ncbi:MAG: amidohydrolase [Deltaproteobacteria bacterium]|nr:MAG: amidohydrolase [Deltaproteobacteria bacterium]
MIIDFHTHIFPREIRNQREKFFKGEPAFELLYGNPRSKMVGAGELVDKLKKCGVDKAVVFGFPWESASIARMHNDYVLEASKRYPDFLIPFACSGLSTAEGINELKRCASLDFRGIGELAFYTDDDSSRQLRAIEPVVEICKKQSLLLLVHSNEPVGHVYPGKAKAGLRFYYELAKICKGMPVILAHWGGGLFFYNTLKKEAPEVLKDVYYDTAASPFLYKNSIYSLAIQVAGADRILFGSDFPLISPERYFREIESAGIGRENVEKIKGENARRLLGNSV